MSLQKFKLGIAYSVINMDNASVTNVEQSNIMALFNTKQMEFKQEQQKKQKKK